MANLCGQQSQPGFRPPDLGSARCQGTQHWSQRGTCTPPPNVAPGILDASDGVLWAWDRRCGPDGCLRPRIHVPPMSPDPEVQRSLLTVATTGPPEVPMAPPGRSHGVISCVLAAEGQTRRGETGSLKMEGTQKETESLHGGPPHTAADGRGGVFVLLAPPVGLGLC